MTDTNDTIRTTANNVVDLGLDDNFDNTEIDIEVSAPSTVIDVEVGVPSTIMGADAKINGYNTVTINANDGITLTQVTNVLTLSSPDIKNKVDKNEAITGGTHTKITYDSKGLVTSGTDLTENDIPALPLAKITDVTATAAEVNVLDGITATTTELNYVDGVTSNIQTQLNNKVEKNNTIIGATHTKITYDSKGLVTSGSDLTENDIPSLHLVKISDVTATAAELNVLDGITATTTELNYVNGVTSNIQTQLDSKVEKNNDITGATHTKITYDNKGLVTSGADLVENDIPSLHLSKINDITATVNEVNVLDGIIATTEELNNLSGTTSNIQTQLNNKVEKNSAITGATKTKITYDSKGLVTSGSDLTENDIPSLHLVKISDVTATVNEVNYLSGTTSNVQTQINSKLDVNDVINNTTTTTTNQALSANMGKELQDQITNLKQRGRYLSIWNCTTGLATTSPTINPYTYKAGDYFLVGYIGTTNYRPNGATYNKDIPSTTVETGSVVVNDAYYYDGTSWALLHTEQPTVAFSTLAGDPYDNTNLTTALNAKVTGNNTIAGATKTKITYDSKGLVTSGTDLQASDIPSIPASKLSDITATATELNYCDGVTSNIQTQLNNKAIPDDIKNGVLTIQRNGVNVKTFSANQSSNETANIEVPTAAGDISYTNPDYPTVGAALDKLLYVKPSVSISGGGNYEIGQTINTVNLSWTWNKNITSQSLNQSIGSLATDVRSYKYTTPTTSNKTFTISGGDGTNTASASTAVNFYYKRYWGVSANTTLTDAEILALSQELSASRAQTRTFNCSGGKYFYIVIPTTYCTGITFKVGGLAFSDLNIVTRNVVNAQGYTASYNIYRPNNIQTGASINVVVS